MARSKKAVTAVAEAKAMQPSTATSGSGLVDKCATRLKELLADGPASALQTAAKLKREGFDKVTVEAARKAIGVASRKDGSLYQWELPTKPPVVIEGP